MYGFVPWAPKLILMEQAPQNWPNAEVNSSWPLSGQKPNFMDGGSDLREETGILFQNFERGKGNSFAFPFL